MRCVATHAIGAKVEVPKVAGKKSRPDAVAVAPNGLTAYIVDGANNLVYPFTISTSTLGTGIAVGTQGDPGAIAVSPSSTVGRTWSTATPRAGCSCQYDSPKSP